MSPVAPCIPDANQWSEFVEARLLWLVEDEHRQYAIEKFLARIRHLIRALSPNNDTSSPDYDGTQSSENAAMIHSGNIYQIHQMRTRSNRPTHKHASTLVELCEEQDRTALLKEMNSLLDLLNWLFTKFWLDSLSGKSGISSKWRSTLIETMTLVSKVENLKLDPGEALRSSLSQITLTLKKHLAAEDLLETNGTTMAAKHSSRLQPSSLEDSMHYIEQRLEGYEAVFHDIVSNSVHHQDPLWLPYLEKNEELLLDKSILVTLFDVVLCHPAGQETKSSKILKLLLRCLSRLPLPIFLGLHQWLWCTPDRMGLYTDRCPSGDYDLSLNQTFNKMTSADTSKLAVQIGCLVLQKPGATLERLLHHVTQNQESMGTLSQVLQCLPQLKETPFLSDTFSKCLLSDRWSKAEESNLINFTLMLCQHAIFPYDLRLPAVEPPMLSCDRLLVGFILPSLLTEGDRAEIAPPLDRALKLMNGLLENAGLPTHLLYTAVMCLCELLERIRMDDLVHHLVAMRAGLMEAMQLVCAKISALNSNANGCSHPTTLWDNLTDFHWSTRLRVSYHLQGVDPCFQKYYNAYPGAMLVLLQTLSNNEGDLRQEDELAAWGMILEATSISRSTAEQNRKIITDAFTIDTFPLSTKSLLMSLTVYLPTCTVSEWRNAAVAVRGLISSTLDVPYTSHFTSYLPAGLHDILADLTISQLMLSLLEMITSGWENTIKCYMATMQEVLTRNRGDFNRSIHSQLFLAGQVFCHACLAIQLTPADHEDTLIILGCEVLGQMEGMDRSSVIQWRLIQRNMLESATRQDALMKKIRDLG